MFVAFLIVLAVILGFLVVTTARAILYARSDQYKVDRRLDAVTRTRA